MGDGMSYTNSNDKHINHTNISNTSTLSTFFAETKIRNLNIALSIYQKVI